MFVIALMDLMEPSTRPSINGLLTVINGESPSLRGLGEVFNGCLMVFNGVSPIPLIGLIGHIRPIRLISPICPICPIRPIAFTLTMHIVA